MSTRNGMFRPMRYFLMLLWTQIYPRCTSLLGIIVSAVPRSSRWGHWHEERTRFATDQREIERWRLSPNGIKSWLFCCPSAGEYEAIAKIIAIIKQKKPQLWIEVAFFSPSGMEHVRAMDAYPMDSVSYLPMDTQGQVEEYFATREITKVIISTLMIWPVFLEYLHRHSIPYSFVNVSFKKKRIYHWLMASYIERAETIFLNHHIQNSGSTHPNLICSGDPRWDTISEDVKDPPKQLQTISDWKGTHKLLVFGSTHFEDEDIVKHTLQLIDTKRWRVIIAPHDMGDLPRLKNNLPESVLLSAIGPSGVLLIDQLGLLKYIYLEADHAYIGGGWRHQLHNISEPLITGCPVSIGPHTNNDTLAELLKKQHPHILIRSGQDLIRNISDMPSSQDLLTTFRGLSSDSDASTLITTKLLQRSQG